MCVYVCVCEGGVCVFVLCQLVWFVCMCMCMEKLPGMVYMRRLNNLNTQSTISLTIPGCNSSISIRTYSFMFNLNVILRIHMHFSFASH